MPNLTEHVRQTHIMLMKPTASNFIALAKIKTFLMKRWIKFIAFSSKRNNESSKTKISYIQINIDRWGGSNAKKYLSDNFKPDQ